MGEREQDAKFETLMQNLFQEGSIVDILYPNRETRLIRAFVNLGAESFSYGKEVRLVARDRTTKEMKILWDRGGKLACSTFRYDKTKIEFMDTPHTGRR